MSNCDTTAATKPSNHEYLKLEKNDITKAKRSRAAANQMIPNGFDIGSVSSFTSFKSNPFTKPNR